MNKNEFDSNIDILRKLLLEDFSKGIYFQEKSLDEEAFNYTLANIHKRIQSFYDHLKTFQDCLDFAKAYTNSELNRSVTNLNRLFKEIEVLSNNEASINKGYLIEDITFKEITNKQQTTDRDGSIIGRGLIYKDMIVPQNTKLNIYSISEDAVSLNSNIDPHSANIKKFEDTGNLLISSIFYNDIPFTINQKITIKLPQKQKINYIKLDESLSDITAYLLLEGNYLPKEIKINQPFDMVDNATHLILSIEQKSFIKENLIIPKIEESYISPNYNDNINKESKINSLIEMNNTNKLNYLIKMEEYNTTQEKEQIEKEILLDFDSSKSILLD